MSPLIKYPVMQGPASFQHQSVIASAAPSSATKDKDSKTADSKDAKAAAESKDKEKEIVVEGAQIICMRCVSLALALCTPDRLNACECAEDFLQSLRECSRMDNWTS